MDLETSLVEQLAALVWIALPDGTLDFINQRWEEIGLSLDDLQGSEWINVLHPDERAAVADKWRVAVETGTPYENIERVRQANGVSCNFNEVCGQPKQFGEIKPGSSGRCAGC